MDSNIPRNSSVTVWEPGIEEVHFPTIKRAGSF